MLGTVLRTHRHAQHHRHHQLSRGHGLPLRELVEDLVAGAAHGPEVPFKLFIVDPAKDKVTPIGPLAAVTGQVDGEMKTGKAEGVTVLDMKGDKAQIVVLFDSLSNGAPHLADVSIPARNKPR